MTDEEAKQAAAVEALEGQNAELKRVQEELAARNAEMQRAQEELKVQNAQLQAAQAELSRQNAKLVDQSGELLRAHSALTIAAEQAQVVNKELQLEVSTLRDQNHAQALQEKTLETRMEALEARVGPTPTSPRFHEEETLASACDLFRPLVSGPYERNDDGTINCNVFHPEMNKVVPFTASSSKSEPLHARAIFAVADAAAPKKAR